jgi:1,2-diacylglycerol 3-alpha-glucosyltransferase
MSSQESFGEKDCVYTIGPVESLASYLTYGIVAKPISAIRKVKNIIKNERPDIIHSNTPLTLGFAALYASRSLRIPIAGTLHTLLPEMAKYYPPLKMKLIAEVLGWQLFNHYYNLCNLITCPTPAVRKLLLRKGIRSETFVVPNGVDIKRFRPSESMGESTRTNLGISNHEKIILFTGRLSFEKRVDLLIMAFKRILQDIPELFLLLLGNGPMKDALIELAKRLKIGSRVLFLGEIEHDSKLIPAIYNAADIFVLPSMFETQGISALEAMACGKAVVATCVGGVADLISDKHNGILIRPNSSNELTKAITSLLADDAACIRIAKNARETVKAYSIESATKKLIRAYERLLLGTRKDTYMALSDIPHAFLYSSTFLVTLVLLYTLQELKMI